MKKFLMFAQMGIVLSLPSCASFTPSVNQCLQNCKELIIEALQNELAKEVLQAESEKD